MIKYDSNRVFIHKQLENCVKTLKPFLTVEYSECTLYSILDDNQMMFVLPKCQLNCELCLIALCVCLYVCVCGGTGLQ